MSFETEADVLRLAVFPLVGRPDEVPEVDGAVDSGRPDTMISKKMALENKTRKPYFVGPEPSRG